MIQPLFSGMLAILLAKFCLNDLPHAAGLTGIDYERPPTTGQLRYIAALCQQLKMTVVYEEQVRTFGEAGRMIRELEAERARRRGWKRLKSGGSSSAGRKFTCEVYEDFCIHEFHPKYADEFSPTYIPGAFPDTPEVTSAINLLSHELYELGGSPILVYREPNNKPLGYAVYQTGFNKLVGADTLDVLLLGSLTTEPGIGTQLVLRLTSMAKEQNLGALTVTARESGLISFYKRLGFTSYPSEELGMIKWIKSSNPNAAVGTCYPDAWRFLIKEDEGYLVHGSVQLTAEGPRVNHAWVELPTDWVWEPQTKSYYTIEDFKIMNPIEEYRYTATEAAIMAARTGNHGPWTDEERRMWL